MRKMVLLLMALLCAATAGCVPMTHDEAVTDEYETDAGQTLPPLELAPTAKPQHAAATPTPKPIAQPRWKEHFDSNDSLLSVDIDVDMPNTQEEPVYEVQPDDLFSQDMVDKMAEICFEDAVLYEKPEPTYAQLQREHANAQKDIESIETGTFPFPDSWSEDNIYTAKEILLDNLNIQIAAAEFLMKTASEEPKLIPANTELEIDEYGLPTMQCAADLGGEKFAVLNVKSQLWGAEMHFVNDGEYNLCIDDPIDVPVGDLTISEADARKQADEVVNALGTGYTLSSAAIHPQSYLHSTRIDMGKHYAYVCCYTKDADNAPSDNPDAPPIKERPEVNDNALSSIGFIWVAINDDGICEVRWRKKIEVNSSAVPKTPLLPFEEVKDSIRQELIQSYPGDTEDEEEGCTITAYQINVESVCLACRRIVVDGDINQQRIIPVWNVYGTIYKYCKKGVNKNPKAQLPGTALLMTVSAIDGSVMWRMPRC